MELKYRARFGRRNVGGRTADGIRASRMDRLTVLLSIEINVGYNQYRTERELYVAMVSQVEGFDDY